MMVTRIAFGLYHMKDMEKECHSLHTKQYKLLLFQHSGNLKTRGKPSTPSTTSHARNHSSKAERKLELLRPLPLPFLEYRRTVQRGNNTLGSTWFRVELVSSRSFATVRKHLI